MNEFTYSDNIPTDDMGCLYGFSLFETFLVNKNGSVFLLGEHIDRIYNSMNFFNFDINMTKGEFELVILRYIESNQVKDKVLRVSVTYGNKSKGIRPSTLITCRDNPYNNEACLKGYKLTVSKYKKNENSPIIQHKTANYLENFLANQNAVHEGFDDAVFLNTKNKITETTRSNIFFISKGTLHTPNIECGILPGIIRGWIIEKAASLGIKCRQGRYPLKMLLESDEIFIANSVMGIMPVYCVDNYIISSILPGKITSLFISEYQNVI